MSIGIEIIGLVLLGLICWDITITTLTLGGGGPISGRVASWVWKVALYLHRRQSNHRLLQMTGWSILVATPLVWFGIAWVAWSLIFIAFEGSVVNATTQVAADIWQRIYFVGFTITTLGLGDYQPQGKLWQIATAIAAANGFFIVSLSITYLLPIVSAAVRKRQISVYISALGGTPDDILVRCWNGQDFGQFSQHLINLTSELSGIGESYLAYPILYYFHAIQRSRDFVLSFVVFDETLTLLKYGIKQDSQVDPASVDPARRANAAFLRTLKSAYIQPSSETPPLLSLDLLKQAGIPTVSDREFAQRTQGLKFRRQLLLAMVEEGGWTWDAVASTKTTNRAIHLDDETLIQVDE